MPVPVLRLITRLNIGGPARQALLLTRALQPQFTTTLGAGRPASGEKELSFDGVVPCPVPLYREPRLTADICAVAVVRRLLADTGARLLHTHMAKAGAIGRLAAVSRPRGDRPRTVHTYHGHVLDGYFRPGAQMAFTEVERRLARRTDVLVAVSAEIRDELLALGVGRPLQYEVIPVGFDLSRFLAVDGPVGNLRSRLRIPPGAALVGAVGRLVPVKDIVTLLEAVERLPGVHLAIVGDGESRSDLEARAAALGLSGRVHFTGWVSDVASAMADLDVVVLTSRKEGTPAALIEAGACARPVVATRVGGVPMVVEDGITGFLVAPGRPDEVAELIGRLLARPDLRRSMGESARAWVRSRFGDQRLVDDMRSLYEALVPTRNGGRIGRDDE